MATFTVKNSSYNHHDDILHELNYIYNKDKILYRGTSNLFDFDNQTLANQFSYIKSYYGKHGGKQLEHFILSFDSPDEEHSLSLNDMISAASHIAFLVLNEYQIAYAIHKPSKNNPCYHIHFIMNSINMLTGFHFRLNQSSFTPFLNSIADALRFSHIALRGFSYYDESDNFRKGKYNDLALYEKNMKKYKYY